MEAHFFICLSSTLLNPPDVKKYSFFRVLDQSREELTDYQALLFIQNNCNQKREKK
jgi:hypothetical protein